ncbi:MAG: 30S ribosomal protein S4 [Syntrophomonadaceae bacterium]|nr:30S ribosomal protein S4 [Syntrophomonadaceae bacterium]
MARYTGPVCRLCRREGTKLFLKGDRCYEKCILDRRGFIPGQHGHSRGKKVSEYGLQLREKQKARRLYGILERQFHNYFIRAERMQGITGENLLSLLERRLDNVIFRLGFATSRSQARQMVRHGHFRLNGHKANIPSMILRPGDVITIRERSKETPLVQENLEAAKHKTPPVWLELDLEGMQGRILGLPTREQIDVPIEETLIVELYSR